MHSILPDSGGDGYDEGLQGGGLLVQHDSDLGGNKYNLWKIKLLNNKFRRKASWFHILVTVNSNAYLVFIVGSKQPYEPRIRQDFLS